MADPKTDKLLKIAKIIAAEKLGNSTMAEQDELKAWLKENENNRSIYMNLQDNDKLVQEIRELNGIDTRKSFKQIEDKISGTNSFIREIAPYRVFMKYAAAILLLIALGIISYILIYYDHPSSVDPNTKLIAGTQKAILITSDKQQISLGDGEGKKIITANEVQITDANHTLFYEQSVQNLFSDAPKEYNEVITPRGGEYAMVLSDGTYVKLNAGSKVRFPVRFSGNLREVELEGEAYFEVFHTGKTPFIVHANSMDVSVLGTCFNISAYPSDDGIQTTLVEGKVSIKTESDEIEMKPGQQAELNQETREIELRDVNPEVYISWTKGLFVFENEQLETILSKLSRWYDFEVIFETEDLKHISFTGDIKRYTDIEPILNMISMASHIQFKTETNKVIVTKK